VRRLRELLQVDPPTRVAIRGVATCKDCGETRLLWFGSAEDARWRRSIVLDDLSAEQAVEIRRLAALITLDCE